MNFLGRIDGRLTEYARDEMILACPALTVVTLAAGVPEIKTDS